MCLHAGLSAVAASASDTLLIPTIKQKSLAQSMARDDPPASSTAAAMRGKVGSEFET